MSGGPRSRLTRRRFLGGMAASVAGLSGCSRLGRDPLGGPYDVAVVGSGFAGTHLALRTAAAGLRTVVVESGFGEDADFVAPGGGSPFAFDSRGEIDYDINRSRVIGVGGTSRHWTGRVNRLRPSDFRLASEFGLDVDWPIGYEDLETHYCAAEQLLSAVGRPYVEGAEPPRGCAYPREYDPPYQPPEIDVGGERIPFFNVARSARPETNRPVRLAAVEIPRLVDLPAATLLSGLHVTEAVTTDGESVDHLLVRSTEGGETHELRARCFVLAAGVIETPRLLLQSRSRWFPEGLGNQHGLVGRHFVEHPTLMLRFEAKEASGVYVGAHRTYYFNDRFRADGLNACHYQIQLNRDGRVDWKAQPEMEPRPENRLSLSDTRRDYHGSPTVALDFGYSERDLRTIDKSLEFLFEEARALGAEPKKLKLIRKFRDHPAGTCRMGFEPTDGVVDRDNRVFGVSNLFASGATTFPTSGTANPTNTVVAMTLRLADHLVELYG